MEWLQISIEARGLTENGLTISNHIADTEMHDSVVQYLLSYAAQVLSPKSAANEE